MSNKILTEMEDVIASAARHIHAETVCVEASCKQRFHSLDVVFTMLKERLAQLHLLDKAIAVESPAPAAVAPVAIEPESKPAPVTANTTPTTNTATDTK